MESEHKELENVNLEDLNDDNKKASVLKHKNLIESKLCIKYN